MRVKIWEWTRIILTVFALPMGTIVGYSIDSPGLAWACGSTWVFILVIWSAITFEEEDREVEEARARRYAAMSDDERVEYHQRAAQQAYFITDSTYHAHLAEIILQKQIRDEQRAKLR